MSSYEFTSLPSFVRFSVIADDIAAASAQAEQLGDEVHDLATLTKLGVRLVAIGFGDPADIEADQAPSEDSGGV